MGQLTETSSQPLVFERDGAAFTSSRAVAEFFQKQHRNVMQAIDGLIDQEPELALLTFQQGVYRVAETGPQEHRCFDMDRDGFSLLAMGFNGAKALKWKIRYIAAFNAMEAELRGGPPRLMVPLSPEVSLVDEIADVRRNLDRMAAVHGEIQRMGYDLAAYQSAIVDVVQGWGDRGRVQPVGHLGGARPPAPTLAIEDQCLVLLRRVVRGKNRVNLSVLLDALSLSPETATQRHKNKIGKTMKLLGFEHARTRRGTSWATIYDRTIPFKA